MTWGSSSGQGLAVAETAKRKPINAEHKKYKNGDTKNKTKDKRYKDKINKTKKHTKEQGG